MNNKLNKHTCRRIFVTFFLTGMLSVFMIGCGNNNNASVNTSTPAGASEESEDADATTDTTKQYKQFDTPAVGDTVAEINVEGYGTIYVVFFADAAPLAVENFLTRAKEGYYDGTLFHRVIDEFMLQGGDPEGTGFGGESIYGEAFADEISEELHPFRGALCMANSGANTNKSQFFIVQKDADSLAELKELVEYKDYDFADYLEAGYQTILSKEVLDLYALYGGTPWLDGHHTVFGQVYEGYEVLDAIAQAQVDATSKPIDDIIISTIKVFVY